MSVLKFLVQQDYFGSSFQVTLNGRERTKTVVGFVFTLAFLGLILFAMVKFLTDYFSTSRPVVLLRDITNDDYPQMRLNHDSLNYFFLVTGTDGLVEPSSVSRFFNMTVYYERLEFSPTAGTSQFIITSAYASVAPCATLPWFALKKADIDPKMRTLIEKHGVCANDSDVDHLLYNGADPPYGHVELMFAKCVLASGCATSAEVSKVEISFGTLEHYFEASDYNSPLKIFAAIKNKVKINANERKEFRYFANIVKVFSDTGFFTTSFSEATGFQLSHPKTDQRKLYPSDLSYLQILFYTSGRHLEYTRTYYKFLNLLSDIGGVIQIIAFCVTVLYAKYNTYVQNKELILCSLLGKRDTDIHQINPTSGTPKAEATTLKLPFKEGQSPSSKNGETPNKRIIAMKDQSPYSPTTPGFNPKSRVRNFGILVDNAKSKRLFSVDDHDFKNTVYLNLVSSRILEPSDEVAKKQAAFYALCEKKLERSRDVYELLASLNEMAIIRHAMVPPEIKPLLHFAALESRQAATEEKAIGYREAIRELLTAEPLSPAQALLTEFMLARIKVFEKRFNGEVRNHLRQIIREIRKSPNQK